MLDNLPKILPIIEFFVDPSFVLFYCTEVLLVAGLLGLLLWKQTVPIIDEVIDARGFLDRARGDRGFYSQFEKFHQYVATLPKLSHTWKEFRQSLILPDPTRGDKIILQTRPASEYFNEETLLSNNINLRFYNWVPNLLTGFGIMGTFIGLSAGVFVAASRLHGDAEQVQSALTTLLRGASLAFSTSFVGILTSITFSVYERTVFRRLHRRILDFSEALDERLRLVTPESLAARQLREVEQQTAQLKSFSTDLAVTIGEALDEKVGARLGPALEKLSDTVAALPALLGESVSDMSSGELQNAGTLLKASRELLEGSVAKFAEVPQQIEASFEALTDSFRRDLEQVTASLGTEVRGALGDISGEFDASGKRFATDLGKVSATLVETIETERAQLENATKTFQGVIEESRRMLSDFSEAVRQTGELQTALNSTASALERAATSADGATEHVRSLAERAVSATENLERGLQQIQHSLAVSEQSWSDHQSRFEGLDAALKGTFKELEGGLAAYTARAGEFMKELDAHVARVSQGLAAAIEPLSETVQELPEEISRLHDTINRLGSNRT